MQAAAKAIPDRRAVPAGDSGNLPLAGWLGLVALIASGVFAYQGSLAVPFLFDDDPAIYYNPTIRHLWPLWGMLVPPATGAPVTSRPIANVSLAINYAVGGLHVEGYHVFNLAAHLLTGLFLYGIIRQTFRQPALVAYRRFALPVAWISALWWLVHPLVTEPVTYVVGRTEVLMGLFYLITIYAAIRAMAAAQPRLWQATAVAACLAGMASKEVMVTAPLMALLYDRTFVSGSFGAAWKQRRGFYLTLAATWGLLAWLMASGGGGSRGGSTGFRGGITWWEYLFTQFFAITRYLRLSLFPHPLIFDYGTYLATNPLIIVPCGLLVLGLGTATAIALWRWPVIGFLGAWFFGILAPSSSIVPVITQTIAERRMYLALPALLVPIAFMLVRGLKRWSLPVGIAIAGAGIAMTLARNRDFQSAQTIWADTVAKWPDEPRPHLNLGFALMSNPASTGDAIEQFRQVIRIKPDFEMAYACLGSALAKVAGRDREAEAAFQRELQLHPRSALGHLDFGVFLSKIPGREQEASTQIQTALRLEPNDVEIGAQAHAALGSLLTQSSGMRAEGIAELRAAISLFPELAEAHANLGLALAQENANSAEAVAELETGQKLKPGSAEIWIDLGTVLARNPQRQPDAIAAYEMAIDLDSRSWQAHYNLGKLLLDVPGRRADAIQHLDMATRLAPDFADAHTSLGVALAADPGRSREALLQFEAAVRTNPAAEDARINLGSALEQVPGRQEECVEQFKAALRLNPSDADAHYRLGCVFAGMEGRTTDAINEFENAVRLEPAFLDAHYNIAVLSQSSPEGISRAIDHLRTILALSPGDTAAKDLLARLTIKLPRKA